jgi:predicted regulator of Ras-like GTPase activity (Roadblock/LC7/MglB family)
MKFQGTKGEWRIMNGGFSKKGDIPNLIQIYATNTDLEMICKVNKDGLLHNKVQNYEANAKLIAAAPELLEACINSLVDIKRLNKQLIIEGKHGYILMENELNNAIEKALK